MKTFILLFILFQTVASAQYLDTISTKPVQYRRGIPLQEGYQTYNEKYAGKDLIEEQRRLFPLQSTGIWTELNPKVPRVDYLGVHFVNTDTGWAVGDLGTLIKTTDGGQTWITEETNTTTPILKVNSFDGQTVIASGFDGILLRSTDGGENWTQITSGLTGDLWGLQMINDTLGWACGTGNSLIKTTDGGQTWQTVTTPGYTSDYWWIEFLNENYGFIAANGKVLRTIDGGNSWDIIQAGDNQALFSVDAIDSLHIAAAGYGGTGYSAKNIYSSDGGNTWINGGSITTHEINCINYVSPDTGYITMSEVGLWKTTNRGQNWKLLDSIPLTNIGEFEIQLFKQQNIGYDAGSSLKIYKADGNLDIWHKLIINDDFVDVFFPTEQKGFVISSGPRGRVYRTFDSGEHWQLAPGPSGYSLLFTDSLTGYLGSTAVWKTTNGGDSWYQTNSPNTYGEIHDILFMDSQIGFESTAGGAIFKTTDGGENWIQKLYATAANFLSIDFIDSLNGWTLTPIYSTSDGGENWIERTDLPIFNFETDISFIDSIGFITSLLELEKTTDGGSNWFTQFTSQYIIRTFGWLSTSHGFIMGDGVYETRDTGENWDELVELRNIGLRKLQAPTNYSAYSIGYQGLIYKYVDTTYTSVELESFSEVVDGHNILLSWSTATETNNKGFDIERRVISPPSRFRNWENIGFVQGNGTTAENHSYTYMDRDVTTGEYIYRLKQIDFDGSYNYSENIKVKVSTPTKFSLEQNFPNPFNPETSIRYSIPEVTNVIIRLYDITGKEIRVLVDEKKQPGDYTIKLKGGKLSSGVYFYRLTTGSGFSEVKKLILLK